MDSEKVFLIDASIFPGNSGSPVFLKPEIASIEGTNAINKSYLLGVISGYRTYEDTAYSQITGQPVIKITENSGLANVVPADYIPDAVKELEHRLSAHKN